MPAEGWAAWSVAVSATLHCLNGCAIGGVAEMAIGTALGFSDLGTIALAVDLRARRRHALDHRDGGRRPIMLLVAGAMESGLGDIL